jgi:hypothetical protein
MSNSRFSVAICLTACCGALLSVLPCLAEGPIHMVSYAKPSDFPGLANRGVNTVLVELQLDASDWRQAYQTAIDNQLLVIPMIWSGEQTAWTWNETNDEWEIDLKKYPESVGAKFVSFLSANPTYFKQTFAIYSFHEPLADRGHVEPKRLRKFYWQMTEQVFANTDVRIYGEDITMGWEQSDECLTGVLDYESHNVYPFCNAPDGKYLPFDSTTNEYAAGTDDLDSVLRLEVAALDARVARYSKAKPSRNNRRPKPILLIQTYASKQQQSLWNRMPSAREMQALTNHLLKVRGESISGLSWYPFRNPSEDYFETLYANRFDENQEDRWAVIDQIGLKLKRNP